MLERLPEAWRVRLRDARMPFLVALLLAALLDHDWDGYVFRTVVTQFLQGHSPYGIAAQQPFYAFLGPTDTTTQWWAYPPLMLLGMAMTYWPALLFHLPPFAERVLWKLPMIASLVALAWVAGAWARRFGSDEDEARKVERRFLWNPFLLLVAAAWGMTDVALMALYLGGLLAYGNGKPGKAGVLVGLAFLVKPFPALLVLPMLPYLVRRHGWESAFRFGAAGAGIVAAVSAPFFLSDPGGFWQQVVGMHLARGVQGLTLWQLVPREVLSDGVVKLLSPLLMVASLVAVGYLSTRLRGKGTSLMLTLMAGIAILVWNRVVNEQYLVLLVAPILVLDQLHVLDRLGHFLTRWTPTLFALVIAIGGFHFLTFLPPDVANVVLGGVPVDVAAERLRSLSPDFWWWLQTILVALVSITLFAMAWLALRILSGQRSRSPVGVRHLLPTGVLGLLLIGVGFLPALGGAAAPPAAFIPATAQPLVGAFTYLWWQNPAHDPAVRYGNWEVVSQVPTIGYYTNTRGVARDQVAAMIGAGIDTAVVSYHRGEAERYRTFQDEATKAGLRVAPLIELNQVYDQAEHHPVNELGQLVPASFYRLDNGTRDAISAFVVDLKAQLLQPSALHMGGRPVVFFYDSYVGGVSFHPEDKASLARTLLSLHSLETLRAAFNDSSLQATVPSVLQYYPTTYKSFNDPGANGLWRAAHLVQHVAFWEDLRARLEAAVGTPLFMVNGDALNERADFQAGTVKSLVSLSAFDGSFIYSPSFTWGNQPKAPFNDTFALWEDRNHRLTAFADATGRLSSFGVAPSYDDTVNRPNGFVIPAFPDGPGGASFYSRSWDSTIAHPPTFPVIATFNEFFEGSSIEPSQEYGARFLEQTLAERQALQAAPAPAKNVLFLLHERSSMTDPSVPELGESHFWGIDALAALPRALPQTRVAAADVFGPAVSGAPDLVLIEGGYGPYRAGPAVSAQLTSWSAAKVPVLTFGPDLALPLNAALGDTCLAGLDAVPGPYTLVPGDRLSARAGGLWLERNGATFHVGQSCGAHAATSVKPWVATELSVAGGGRHDTINGQCMAVALKALEPAFAAPDAPSACQP